MYSLREELLRARDEGRRVLVIGSGRSGEIGSLFADRLYFDHEVDAFKYSTERMKSIGEGDVVITISGSGETRDSKEQTKVAKDIGAEIFVITSRPNSSIAKLTRRENVIHLPGRSKMDRGKSVEDEIKGAPPVLGTSFEVAACFLSFNLADLSTKLDKGMDAAIRYVGNLPRRVDEKSLMELNRLMLKKRRFLIGGGGYCGKVAKCAVLRGKNIEGATNNEKRCEILDSYTYRNLDFSPTDVLIAISGDGNDPFTLNISSRALKSGAVISSITFNKRSPIAQMSEVCVSIPFGESGIREFEPGANLILDSELNALLYTLGLNEERIKEQHENISTRY